MTDRRQHVRCTPRCAPPHVALLLGANASVRTLKTMFPYLADHATLTVQHGPGVENEPLLWGLDALDPAGSMAARLDVEFVIPDGW
ncbi:MAG: hypothetical protein H6922_00395 [Pseudomonadaceae bacterium]|nr:hypothetical protein [Pseudomonadaceae bacterium]